MIYTSNACISLYMYIYIYIYICMYIYIYIYVYIERERYIHTHSILVLFAAHQLPQQEGRLRRLRGASMLLVCSGMRAKGRVLHARAPLSN